MLKNILKLEGVQGLTKNEQKKIDGGVLGSGGILLNSLTCEQDGGEWRCHGPALGGCFCYFGGPEPVGPLVK